MESLKYLIHPLQKTKLMKLFYKRLLLFTVAIIIPLSLVAQRPSRTVRKAQKKSEKTELQQKRDYEKARKQALKRRYKIQTKQVQERMKESKREANRNNRKRKDPILKRVFRKRRR
ncbi:MAG: hypothetical protein JSV24_01010 [Bacteroidales bacterium]|nr:MAG: hypothetical protein JSV24_01010 [Bacteroidales bacterium]